MVKSHLLPANAHKSHKNVSTVNFLNIQTPKKFVVITLKVEQDGISLNTGKPYWLWLQKLCLYNLFVCPKTRKVDTKADLFRHKKHIQTSESVLN